MNLPAGLTPPPLSARLDLNAVSLVGGLGMGTAMLRRAIRSPLITRGFGEGSVGQGDILVCTYPRSGSNWMMYPSTRPMARQPHAADPGKPSVRSCQLFALQARL